MSVWDESPLPPPRGETPSASDVPDPTTVGTGGTDGGDPPPSRPGSGERPPDHGDDRALFRRVGGVPVWLLAAIAVIAVVVVAVWSLSSGDDPSESATDRPAAPSPTLPPPPAATSAPAAVITSPPVTTAAAAPEATPTSSDATTTPTEPTAPATTPGTTAPASTTPTTTPTTTAAPATTAAPSTSTPPVPGTGSESSTVVDQGRTLTVTPRRESCRAGSDCLVVGFTIDGFANRPDEFVCEFASGQRYTYRFSGTSVETACSTRDVPDSIVVEVDGLRSDPITNGR